MKDNLQVVRKKEKVEKFQEENKKGYRCRKRTKLLYNKNLNDISVVIINGFTTTNIFSKLDESLVLLFFVTNIKLQIRFWC
jgi:hypothetical protein